MTPYDRAQLDNVRADQTTAIGEIRELLADVRNIRATGINTETRVAALAELIGTVATGDLTPDEIKAAVQAALREGTG